MRILLALLSSSVSNGTVQAAQGGGPVPDGESAGPILVWGDFDRDGLQDVYALLRAGQDRLLRNAGDGSFADVTRAAFQDVPLASRSAAWGDADGDGWIDLYVASVEGSARLLQNLGNGTFLERTRDAGLGELLPGHEARWLDYDGDERLDLVLSGPSVEVVLHNQGDWKFERMALPPLQESAPFIGIAPPAVVSAPAPDRAPAAGSTRSPRAGAAVARAARGTGAGSSSDTGSIPISSSSGPRASGQPGRESIEAAGIILLGESSVAPSGFTATGWQLDVNGLWTPRAPMSAPRYSMDAASLNGRIYVVGGYDTGVLARVEEYDLATDAWTTKAAMPTARNTLAVAAAGGKVYAIAGHDGTSYLTTVEEYDPVADTWASRAPRATAATGSVAATVNGKIYVIGGHDGSNYLATVEEYDPVADAWTSKASMPTARFKPAAAALDGKIYVMGGSITGSVLGVVEVYDPLANAWTVRAPMPTARYDLISAVVGGRIYAVAGYNFAPMATVEVYFPSLDTWIPGVPLSTARENLAGGTIGARIFAIGGWGGGLLATVEAYAPALNLHRKN